MKSKAPASGVPARLRVFCLTPCSIAPPNSASSSAPAQPQGLRGVVRPVGLYVLDLRKRWREQPRPEVGRVRQSHQDRPWTGSIPARRGGTINAKSRRAFDRSSRSSILSIGDFPVPENRRSRETKIWGPSRAENFWRGAPRRYPHSPSSSICNHRVHWRQEPLWLNRAPTERVAQAKAQPSGDERKRSAITD